MLLTYAGAINDAMKVAMRMDRKVICYGLGVTDPKRIFGTTNDLVEMFGPERVFDMPASENAMTGVGIGAALAGYRPVFVNQRLDFTLLALDQIVNAAAKWNYMFGGRRGVPLVVRMVVGRGWGQGPTHSQCLHSWFAHIPGLQVVMPASPSDAKGLLLSGIFSGNPVIYIEHRWLHNMNGEVPDGDFRVTIGKANILRTGKDVTVVAMSNMVVEAIHILDHLGPQGVTADLIDLRSVRPIDWDPILKSVKKTGRLVVLEVGAGIASVASEVIARVAMQGWGHLRAAPERICLPDHAVPTSVGLTKGFYPDSAQTIAAISRLVGKELESESLVKSKRWPHDVPGDWFKGPF